MMLDAESPSAASHGHDIEANPAAEVLGAAQKSGPHPSQVSTLRGVDAIEGMPQARRERLYFDDHDRLAIWAQQHQIGFGSDQTEVSGQEFVALRGEASRGGPLATGPQRPVPTEPTQPALPEGSDRAQVVRSARAHRQ